MASSAGQKAWSGKCWRDVSRNALDLLAWRDQAGRERPTVREVRWFHRVRVAAPDAPIEKATQLAEALMSASAFASRKEPGTVRFPVAKWYLAYTPWKGQAE